jgi:hypothetical protein
MSSLDEAETTKVIEDYGIVLEELFSRGPLCVYDERHLPYPKSAIRNALYLRLREYPYELWEKIEEGEKTYNSLLHGLFSVVMFQKELGDWQIRIPDPAKEDLTQLDKNHVRSLTNYIDSILCEIKETCEKLTRLKIKFDVGGEVDQANAGLVILLGVVSQKLKEQI